MANQTLTLLTNALSQELRPEVVRTINRTSVAMHLLRVVPGSGKNESWDIETDGAVAETYTEGADVSNYGTDAVQPATLNRARYRSNFSITGDAQDAAMTSSSPAGLMRPVKRNFDNSLARLSSFMNIDVYAGGGGNAMVGLDTALRDDNTYATIDRTNGDNAGFRGNLIDPGTSTTVSIDQIRRDIGDTIYTKSGDAVGQVDIALCKPNIWYALAAKFDPGRRWTDSFKEMDLNRGRIVLNGSVEAILIDGCYFIKDKDATANRIYYLNSRYVEVVAFQQVNDALWPKTSEMQEMDLNDGGGAMPFGLKVYEIARTGDARKATLQIKPQLVVRRPNACGMRLNVSAS